jgi:hypothetical protein
LVLLKASVAPLRAAAASEEPVVWAATGVITVTAALTLNVEGMRYEVIQGFVQ